VEASLGRVQRHGRKRDVLHGSRTSPDDRARISARGVRVRSLGLGAASASCYQVSAGAIPAWGRLLRATFLEIRDLVRDPRRGAHARRLKLLGGFTDLSPGPVQSNGAECPNPLLARMRRRLLADYDTQLDHFAVGLDALVRETFAGSSLKILRWRDARIRYVF